MATDTLSDSDVLRPAGKLGIRSLLSMSLLHSLPIPFPSLPITMSPLPVSSCVYMSFPSRNVPYMGALSFMFSINSERQV